jgi:hypothetical protein
VISSIPVPGVRRMLDRPDQRPAPQRDALVVATSQPLLCLIDDAHGRLRSL